MSMTIKEMQTIARHRLTNEGCADPALDAEILLCHALGKDKTYLFVHYADQLDEKVCENYFKLVDIRAGGVPVQHITGEQEFMGLPLKVNEHVLIPRQDTETLVERTLQELKQRKPRLGGFHILDLCCGSGAIAISLARHSDQKQKIDASDLSKEALAVAKENAARNGVAGYIRFRQGDLFGPFPTDRNRKGKKLFDLIVCNPPYIRSGEIPTLMREVRDHEPLIALDGGPEGVDFYLRILAEAHQHLMKDGLLLLEIGHDQAAAVTALAEETGAYGPAEIIKDPAGRDRVITFRKK